MSRLRLCLMFSAVAAMGILGGCAGKPSAPPEPVMGQRAAAPFLTGKTLALRLYRSTPPEEKIYDKAESVLQGTEFRLPMGKGSTPALVAAFPGDQRDAVVKRTFGGQPVFWPGEPSGFYAIPLLEGFTQIGKHKVVIKDAMLNPIAGARVEMMPDPRLSSSSLGFPFGSVVADKKGQVAFPYFVNGPTLRLRISHPDYGVAETTSDAFAPLAPGKGALPLVRKGTPQYERALRGVVVDPDGKPMPDVDIQCDYVRTPDMGSISARGSRARTDKNGRFVMYLSNVDPEAKISGLIPPSSKFVVRIDPPAGSGLFSFNDELPNTEEARIVMRRGDAFHTFAFEDEDGKRIESSRYNEIRVVRVAEGELWSLNRISRDTELPKDTLTLGGEIRNGSYSAHWVAGDRTFEPVEVTDKTPKDIVFRLERARIYEGRVVDPVSGQGVAGAFVAPPIERYDVLTAADWVQLRKLPVKGPVQSPGLRRKAGELAAKFFVRTDARGAYRIEMKPGEKIYALAAYGENSLESQRRTNDLKPDAQGRIAVGDLPLFPAARVVVQSKKPPSLPFYARWTPDKAKCPAWAERLLGGNYAVDDWTIARGGRLALGDATALVPARVPFRLSMHAAWSPGIEREPVELPEVFVLEGGQTRTMNVEALEFPAIPMREVAVRVANPKGKPVEGVPVRLIVGNGAGEPHYTDAKGMAVFQVPEGKKAKLGVSTNGKTRTHNAEVPIEIASGRSESQVYPLTLTDAHIAAIFNPRRIE